MPRNRAFYLTVMSAALILATITPKAYPTTTPHFKPSEFTCPCCHELRLDPQLLVMLEKLRAELGDEPITITSGYRCPKHNQMIGGAKRSQHMLGRAADIKAKHYTPAEVGHFARMLGFGYVKVYKTWTHVDVRRTE